MSPRLQISSSRNAFGSVNDNGTLPETGVTASTFNSGERSARKNAIASSTPGSVSKMILFGLPASGLALLARPPLHANAGIALAATAPDEYSKNFLLLRFKSSARIRVL